MMQGVLALASTTAVMAAAVGLVLYAPSILRRAREAARWLGLATPPPPPPARFPLERLAADLVRIRADIERADPETSVARRRATVAAYDDTLTDACDALGVPTTLPQETAAFERDVERLRVEAELRDAGLLPPHWPRAA